MSQEEAPKKRTVAEIEADLQRTRAELTRAVDELSSRVDPRRQVKDAKEQATAKGKAFIDDVKNGDPKAIGILSAAGAAVIAVVGLVVVRSKK